MSKQGSGEAWGNDFEADKDNQNCQRDEQARQMRISQVLKSEKELAKKAMATLLDAEHFVKLTDGNLNTDSRQKADKYSTGEKIRQEAQAKDSRQKKDTGRNECDEAGEFDVPRGIGGE